MNNQMWSDERVMGRYRDFIECNGAEYAGCAVMTEQPKRHIEMTLTIGADTRREMAMALEDLARQVSTGELSGSGLSGGPSWGYRYTLTVNDGVTHDSYFEALRIWLVEPDDGR